jgi:hypothetical protein
MLPISSSHYSVHRVSEKNMSATAAAGATTAMTSKFPIELCDESVTLIVRRIPRSPGATKLGGMSMYQTILLFLMETTGLKLNLGSEVEDVSLYGNSNNIGDIHSYPSVLIKFKNGIVASKFYNRSRFSGYSVEYKLATNPAMVSAFRICETAARILTMLGHDEIYVIYAKYHPETIPDCGYTPHNEPMLYDAGKYYSLSNTMLSSVNNEDGEYYLNNIMMEGCKFSLLATDGDMGNHRLIL